MRRRLLASSVAALSLALVAASASYAGAPAHRRATAGQPLHLSLTVPQGQLALQLTWETPAGLDPSDLLGYQVQLGSGPLLSTGQPSLLITDGLVLGHTYAVSVHALTDAGSGDVATASTQLIVNAVTTAQAANPDNPLAGRDWGVYRGASDPLYAGWSTLGAADRDTLALLAMTSKAKYFGSWIADSRGVHQDLRVHPRHPGR